MRTIVLMTERRINGAALRAIRSALGVSQVDLAARCGWVDGSHVNRIESGAVKEVTPKVQRLLADGLGVSLEAITYPVVTAA